MVRHLLILALVSISPEAFAFRAVVPMRVTCNYEAWDLKGLLWGVTQDASQPELCTAVGQCSCESLPGNDTPETQITCPAGYAFARDISDFDLAGFCRSSPQGVQTFELESEPFPCLRLADGYDPLWRVCRARCMKLDPVQTFKFDECVALPGEYRSEEKEEPAEAGAPNAGPILNVGIDATPIGAPLPGETSVSATEGGAENAPMPETTAEGAAVEDFVIR